MTRSVVGVFANQEMAERAINDLESAGFDPTHMGIAMRDRRMAKDVAEEEGITATAGAITGGLVGGTAGALLAAAGALVVPGVGPFLAGGILAGVLVGGAAGWLIGGLVGLGIPEEEARYYQSRVEAGSVLLTVATPYRAREAWEIMRQDGAEDLREMGFGGYPNDVAVGVDAEPPKAEVDGTTVPPDGQPNAEPGSLPPDGQPHAQPGPLPTDGSVSGGSSQSAHVPEESAREVEEGGFDAPEHPMLDKDIIAEDTGHAGQPQRPSP